MMSEKENSTTVSIIRTPVENIFEELIKSNFIDSTGEFDEQKEVSLGILSPYEKALSSCLAKYSSEAGRLLEGVVLRAEVGYFKEKQQEAWSLACSEVDVYLMMLHLEWQKRFPQYNPIDLEVRKGFLLVNTQPLKII